MSGVFQGGRKVCLSFFYHMYGKDIGSLTVFAVEARKVSSPGSSGQAADGGKDDQQNMQVIWRKRGAQGNMWNKALLDLHIENDYKVYAFILVSF